MNIKIQCKDGWVQVDEKKYEELVKFHYPNLTPVTYEAHFYAVIRHQGYVASWGNKSKSDIEKSIIHIETSKTIDKILDK